MKRRVFLTLLVSDEEKAILERLAEETGGGGMSAYVRRMIRQEGGTGSPERRLIRDCAPVPRSPGFTVFLYLVHAGAASASGAVLLPAGTSSSRCASWRIMRRT